MRKGSRPTIASLAIAFVIAGGVAIAACGGAPQTPPAQPGTQPPAPGFAPGPPAASGGTSAASHGNGGVATLGTAPFTGEMKPIVASAMAADLQAIGLDPKALPPLGKLDPDKLRKVMKTFTKALGVTCTDCHVENDFRASTPRKAIAAGMWDHFARPLAMTDGALVYCDSCHQGRITPLLDRHDKKALSQWMDANYVDKVKRIDGAEHTCATCHGDPFKPEIIAAWAQAGSHK